MMWSKRKQIHLGGLGAAATREHWTWGPCPPLILGSILLSNAIRKSGFQIGEHGANVASRNYHNRLYWRVLKEF